KELLSAIKSKAETNNLDNIEIIWSDLEAHNGSRLKENSVDLVIISNILFQSENKKIIIDEARRILKNDERLAVIEWLKEDGTISMGPPNEQRIAKNDCISLVAGLGFKMEKDFNAGGRHYGLIFKKL
ncbi:MAG: methyltransferase domain-containing protein, partial [Patescibacteria group bacterium]